MSKFNNVCSKIRIYFIYRRPQESAKTLLGLVIPLGQVSQIFGGSLSLATPLVEQWSVLCSDLSRTGGLNGSILTRLLFTPIVVLQSTFYYYFYFYIIILLLFTPIVVDEKGKYDVKRNQSKTEGGARTALPAPVMLAYYSTYFWSVGCLQPKGK